MIVVKIFSDFCSSETCQEIFERIWPSDDQIRWTTDDSFSHAILLNQAMPRLFLPRKNVLGFALEPPEFLHWKESHVTYMKATVSKYFIGNTGNTSPFLTHHGFLWHIPYAPTTKTDMMSIMVSEKQYAPGHKYRHMLVSEILKTNLPIHIFGRGCPEGSDARLKGSFTESEPYDAYKFHVAIENFQTHAYFSEKISNCLQRNCVPVYLGAKDLPFEDYVIRLTGDLLRDMDILKDICGCPEKFLKTIDPKRVSDVLDIRPFLKQHWI